MVFPCLARTGRVAMLVAALTFVGCDGGKRQALRELRERGTPANGLSLHAAVGRNDVEEVRLLLEAGVFTGQRNEAGEQPLHVAVRCGWPHQIRMLVDAGADLDARTTADVSPLAYALARGDEPLVETLLAAGVPVAGKSPDGETLVAWAIREGRTDQVRRLLAAGADAIMGAAFATGVMGVEKPRVGIMSNGEEDDKGTAFTKETFALIREFVASGRAPFEFVGNVEGHDLFEERLDVCLCDGFTGNVVLKACEATAKAMSKWLKSSLTASPVRKLGAAIARGAFAELKHRASAESYGGSPLLGVNGVVIIAHGGSTALAIRNAIRVAAESVNHRVNPHIEQTLASLRPSG